MRLKGFDALMRRADNESWSGRWWGSNAVGLQEKAGPASRLAGIARRVAVVALVASPLAGCASTFVDLPIVGEPANTPRAPAEGPAYLAVHDMPAPRAQPIMDSNQQERVQNDLIAARDRTSASATATAARDVREAQVAQRQAQADAARLAKAQREAREADAADAARGR